MKKFLHDLAIAVAAVLSKLLPDIRNCDGADGHFGHHSTLPRHSFILQAKRQAPQAPSLIPKGQLYRSRVSTSGTFWSRLHSHKGGEQLHGLCGILECASRTIASSAWCVNSVSPAR